MAQTLLEALQGGGTTLAPQDQLGPQDQTAQARRLLLAKSGKAGAADTGGEAASSSLGESSARDAAAANLGQLGVQGGIQQQAQAQAQSGAEEQARQGVQSLATQKQGNQLQLRMQTNELLGGLERSGKQLDAEKDKAALEQVAQGLALQDKKYLDNLQQEGVKSRLTDQMSWSLEYQKSILGDSADILREQIGNDSLAQAKERDIKKMESEMDLHTAFELGKRKMKAEGIKRKYEGISKVVGGGISMIGGMSK